MMDNKDTPSLNDKTDGLGIELIFGLTYYQSIGISVLEPYQLCTLNSTLLTS